MVIAEKPHAADEPPEVYAVHIDHSPSNSGLVVTGGRDDTAYVWFMNSGQILFECTGMLHLSGEYTGMLHSFLTFCQYVHWSPDCDQFIVAQFVKWSLLSMHGSRAFPLLS